jgi:Ca-activated chloride channel family protein|tara:strand:+ start:4645 stop:5397 length:753 start_codon:yes stop_codon:yes gene_type:complete
MDIAMVSVISNRWFTLLDATKRNKRTIITILILIGSLFAYLRPQQFTDLWLTRDQQGQLLFKLGHYQQASNTYKNTQWQAYSSYGAEQYKNAATLYGQFTEVENQIAKANALAHAREYLSARNLYQQILTIDPQNLAANTNIHIVQAIIDEVNRLSASQAQEDGESIKELGDEPQTGDGAEREVAPKEQEIEQLSAEQLLLDPGLNAMWLRQVQKNPAHFLSQKFYMQQEIKNQQPLKEDTNDKQGVDNE